MNFTIKANLFFKKIILLIFSINFQLIFIKLSNCWQFMINFFQRKFFIVKNAWAIRIILILIINQSINQHDINWAV